MFSLTKRRPNKYGLARLAHGPSYFLSLLCSHFLFSLLNKVDDVLFVEANNRLFACQILTIGEVVEKLS
jgi:hypothetical protein